MKQIILQFTPAILLKAYHLSLSWLAAFWFGNPSEELIVIGVTGTNGKSTTVNLIASILEQAGNKVALTSTVNFKIASSDKLNDLKMTMPGRFFLQQFLRRAVSAGCKYAIIESSSEGVLQYRHVNIHYDAMVMTNLAPEHLERHGGFENYKQAKLEYFRHLAQAPRKIIGGLKIDKVIVANGNDEHAKVFLNFSVDKKFVFGIGDIFTAEGTEKILAEQAVIESLGSSFQVQGVKFKLLLPGHFNIENSLAAVSIASSQGVALKTSSEALAGVSGIPGRLESISEGQQFAVIVDYAYEPNALHALYQAIALRKPGRILQVLGGTGGGRDIGRRPILGKLAAENTSTVIITTDDPYDDDPVIIADQVAQGAIESGKQLGQNLFKILDRREAIRKAFTLAGKDDLVLITGKGAEQKMALSSGRYISWDDRTIVREELTALKKSGSKLL